jgi:hypothetical protein
MAEPTTSTDQNYTFDPESVRSAAEKIAKTFPTPNSRDFISDYVAKHAEGLSKSTLGIAESFLKDERARLSVLGVYPTSKMPVYTPPPDPGYETNGQLYKMNARVEALIQVAERQAELIQVMNESAKATLELASQSSLEAKASTELARTSTELARSSLQFTRFALWIAVISIVINIAVSIYLNQRNSSTDLRSREVQILNDISSRLAADAKARVDATQASVPQKPNTKAIQSNK